MKLHTTTLGIDDYFRLHTDVIMVEADQKDVLYDIGKSNLFPINKEISKLLSTDLMESPIKSVLSQYSQSKEIIIKYLEHLITNNLGHVSNTPENHPAQDMSYYGHKKFRDAVIYFDLSKDYRSTITTLNEAGVDSFFVILKEDVILDQDIIDKLTILFEGKHITYVQIVASNFSIDIGRILENCPLENFFFTFHNQSEDTVAAMEKLEHHFLSRIGSSMKEFDPYGKHSYEVEKFYIYNERFIAAKHFNAGLHRLIAIDYDGSIKNYLSHKKKFGNVFQDNILEIINGEDFQKQWNIKNDDIEKCSTCKYRYCCSSTTEVYQDKGKYYKTDYCSF